MSLQLSASRPRQLAYKAGGLRSDLRLLEVDDALLAEIARGGCGHMRAAAQQEGGLRCAAASCGGLWFAALSLFNLGDR